MQKQRKRKQVAAFPQITRLGPPHPEKAANRPLTSVVYGWAEGTNEFEYEVVRAVTFLMFAPLRNGYELLLWTVAGTKDIRREFDLFQYHDDITRTSRIHVVSDYGNRLSEMIT
ncbi:hypothetical protein DPMN_040448 [Dreissena polymorpha]|uniref:Uncharacterized protein n=1 Tax=Dreissena polymorpha TaxID=45954 RepID=A0A9D4CWR2_DREPO|nr:hypothetical protein DPMN_040448 [Dreissena polymorpha]